MLQRIQTVFLFLIVLFMTGVLFFNVWTGTSDEGIVNLTSFYLEIIAGEETEFVSNPYLIIAVLSIASATLAMIEIFRYRNRLLQIKLGALNSLFMAATIVSMVLFSNSLTETYAVQTSQYGISLYLPVAAMICNLLANRFIRKDEKLVRSVDRIR
ncbi:DUF4293 domain-containing protein [Fulvivirga sedimenti]|uniref:DUF4293 domain-containing protein n=1 Tax=Fulvivirga sedimenti TaxID=2879465 RepID=A0A9X1HV48_9BACT|nr:DUF4293 domain-containing protein [Fulvivirga sedimenti]MCA6078471.1 DUF4293 domain-containing protein [Fulvivirga sedimenti]